MNDASIERIVQELLFEHEERLNTSHEDRLHKRNMQEALHAGLYEALHAIDDDAMWAIARPGLRVFVLAGNTLRTIGLDDEARTVTASSSLVDQLTSATCARVPPNTWPDDWRQDVEDHHVWRFRFDGDSPDDPPCVLESAVFGDSASDEDWPDRPEELARSVAAIAGGRASAQTVRGIEQDLIHAGRFYRKYEDDRGELQALISEAVAYHHLTAEGISERASVPVAVIVELNDSPQQH